MRYPTDMLDVPEDRWNAEIVASINVVDDEGNNCPQVTYRIEASTQDEAERRVLSVQHYDYEDPLDGARAEGTQDVPGIWHVTIIMAPYR